MKLDEIKLNPNDNIIVDSESIIVVGDVHKRFNILKKFIEENEITNTTIIIAGDCGIGFSNIANIEYEIDFFLKEICETNNVNILMVRGNHDNPYYFKYDLLNVSDRIKLLPDYAVVNNEILCIGGAVSIDRTNRIAEKNYQTVVIDEDVYNIGKNYVYLIPGFGLIEGDIYWKDEIIVYDENKLEDLKSKEIKHVITHTCPHFCCPTSTSPIQYWLDRDTNLETDITKERNILTKVYDKLIADGHPLKTWSYGHYHDSYKDYINGVKFTMINNMDSYNSYKKDFVIIK